MASGSTDGVRVLDLTQNFAGPFCTQILADFGASVVKIERPGAGDDTGAWTPVTAGGESATFLALNRGKQSVGVDIAQPEGVALVARLAARSDVIVHSIRPASMRAHGPCLRDARRRESGARLLRDQRVRRERAVA